MKNFTSIALKKVVNVAETETEEIFNTSDELLALILVADHLTPEEALEQEKVVEVKNGTPPGESLLFILKTWVYESGSGNQSDDEKELLFIQENIDALVGSQKISETGKEIFSVQIPPDLTPIEAL